MTGEVADLSHDADPGGIVTRKLGTEFLYPGRQIFRPLHDVQDLQQQLVGPNRVTGSPRPTSLARRPGLLSSPPAGCSASPGPLPTRPADACWHCRISGNSGP